MQVLYQQPSRHPRESSSESYSAEYQTWLAMRRRCENPKDVCFRSYGARGIHVCARWHSFDAFLHDMGRRPSKQHSIDRIDNDKGYSPSNCRWLLRHLNTTHGSKYVAFGEAKTIRGWAKDARCQVTLSVLKFRFHHYKWPLDRALSTPSRKYARKQGI